MLVYRLLASYHYIIIVWRSHGPRVTILLQRVNIRPSMHQTWSPLCFRYGINEQILFQVGIRSEIERFVEGMIVTIQIWIAPISYSNCSAAVVTEAIEVDSKPFKSILPFKVKVLQCYMCMYKQTSLDTLFIIRVKNCSCDKFSWVPLPMKIF